MKLKTKDVLPILKDSFAEWNEDKAPRLGAALAYYTAFSLAPLLLLMVWVTSKFMGSAQAQAKLLTEIKGVVGPTVAKAITSMLAQAHGHHSSGLLASIIGFVMLLAGASGLFGQLQDALNTIWEVAPKPGRGILATLKDRLASYTMVVGVCFLLLVSLVLSTAVEGASKYAAGLLPLPAWILEGVNLLVSFAVIALLFAMIFKVLPDVKMAWNDVWVGAIVTSLLFTIGKFALTFYLGHSNPGSGYGAAGSLVALLLWVYYAAQILFFGAEVTKVYADRYGSRLIPTENAIPVTEEARANQGMPRLEHLKAAAEGKAPGSGSNGNGANGHGANGNGSNGNGNHGGATNGRSGNGKQEEHAPIPVAAGGSAGRSSGEQRTAVRGERMVPFVPGAFQEALPPASEAGRQADRKTRHQRENERQKLVALYAPGDGQPDYAPEAPAPSARHRKAVAVGIALGVAASVKRLLKG